MPKTRKFFIPKFPSLSFKLKIFVLCCRFDELLAAIDSHSQNGQFVICSGGVSMGDKDFLKDVLKKLDFTIHFGRVNMKPG